MRKLIIIATIVIVSRTPSYANLSLEAPPTDHSTFTTDAHPVKTEKSAKIVRHKHQWPVAPFSYHYFSYNYFRGGVNRITVTD